MAYKLMQHPHCLVQFSVHFLLWPLPHPLVSIITSTRDNIQTCLPALTAGSLLPSFSLYCVATTLVFLFCEHIKILSMLGFLYFLKSLSPSLYKNRPFSSVRPQFKCHLLGEAVPEPLPNVASLSSDTLTLSSCVIFIALIII